MISRQEAQHRIAGEVWAERELQDRQWGGPEHDDTHTPHDWKTFILKQAHGLAHKVYDVPGSGEPKTVTADDYRERLVKIAALAIAALESYDRKESDK